jgi:hypothetical protein
LSRRIGEKAILAKKKANSVKGYFLFLIKMKKRQIFQGLSFYGEEAISWGMAKTFIGVIRGILQIQMYIPPDFQN